MSKFKTDLQSVCGHQGDRVVQYGARRGDGRLNSICSPCLGSGLYFVREVGDDFDILLEGGHFVEVILTESASAR